MTRARLGIVWFVFLGLLTLNAWSADNSLKSAYLDTKNMPKKVLILDPNVLVKELSAGGVAEKMEEWSLEAKKNVHAAIGAITAEKKLFEQVGVPTNLAEEEVMNLDEHVALYDVVGFNAFYFGKAQFDAWKHKKPEFDYTLGTGLKGLAERTGADAALFIVGEDYISSGGRKAARIFAALLGVALPASPTFLSVGLVDLKTGNLLWMDYGLALDSKDLRKQDDVNKMLQEMFAHYPASIAGM